jgi:hypothetical protein
VFLGTDESGKTAGGKELQRRTEDKMDKQGKSEGTKAKETVVDTDSASS